MMAYDLGCVVLRGKCGVHLGRLGLDDRQSKTLRVYGPGSTFTAGPSKENVGGYGVKRLRDHVKTDGTTEPSLSGLLFTTLARLNVDVSKERKAWAAGNKALHEGFEKAYRAKVDEGRSAREAAMAEFERQRKEFRDFQDTAQKRLDGTVNRANAAEDSLAAADIEMQRQRKTIASKDGENAILLQQCAQIQAQSSTLQTEHMDLQQAHAALQRNADTAVRDAKEQASKTIANKDGENATLRKQCAQIQAQYSTLQTAHSNLQQAYAALQRNADTAVRDARDQASAAVAETAKAAQAARTSAAASSVRVPVSSQVAAHLQPMASWVEAIVSSTALPLGGEFLLGYLVQNAHDKAAIERLMAQVRSQAMRAMPHVQLLPNNKQRLIAYINAGPAGWVWPPTMAQGSATSKACDMEIASPAPVRAPASAPAPAAVSAPAPAVVPAPVPAVVSAPVSAPVASHAAAPAPSVSTSQAAYAKHMQRLNAMGNPTGRQASHARNAAVVTPAAVTTVNAFSAPTLPSAPASAPIPATLGATAVSGAKSQQNDSIGPTSGRSRRRVGR